MHIRKIAQETWAEQDVKDMLCNIMDIAKQGSLRHAEFVFKVLTYESKADSKGQLQIPFENNDITVKIVRSGTTDNDNL